MNIDRSKAEHLKFTRCYHIEDWHKSIVKSDVWAYVSVALATAMTPIFKISSLYKFHNDKQFTYSPELK
jgi:hypothetical protein